MGSIFWISSSVSFYSFSNTDRIPAGWVEEQPYQQEQVVRLISVGKPELNAETGSLSVPCQVEVEKDGQTSVQSIVFRVQQVQGRSGPWKIIDF